MLIVDTSGSMEVPGSKIRAARRAAATAMRDAARRHPVRPGGRHRHGRAAPTRPTAALVAGRRPHPRTRRPQVARRLRAGGGTAISTWLDLHPRAARAPPRGHPPGLPAHRRRQPERDRGRPRRRPSPGPTGVFQCDTRGVGADWDVAELRHDRLRPAGRGRHHQAARRDGRRLPGLPRAGPAASRWPTSACACGRPRAPPSASSARWPPPSRTSRPRRSPVNALTREYPTGAWSGDESRDYHVCVDVPPAAVGDERLAARISLMVGDDAVSQGLVRAVWTDDDGPVHPHQRPGGPLHRAGRAGPGHPGGPAGPQGRRHRHAPRSSWAGPCSWPPSRATRAPCGCCARWWRWRTRTPARSG